MKRINRGALALAMLAVTATAALAATVNGVTNGDFETGNTNGWTYSCPASGGATTGILGATDLVIDSGSTWGYLNDQAQAAVDCDLYQDVTIPASATAATLTMRYALTGSNAADGTETRRIDVTTPAGVVLVNIQPSVNRGTTRAFAPLGAPVNLTAYAGQTVRIRARTSNPANSGSANAIGIDDVVLNITTPNPVPTLSEWAMILFGLVLAGGAALMVQRRRFV
ncbi:IPTL-CTERM sorting domain-containing protein [Brevundimonas sp.]|uniref:IPTL-CTERM sorting domain-containing protein n=1 Tax=Brevundimonas sp. TaxID=1871086 RepID=UPI003D15356A